MVWRSSARSRLRAVTLAFASPTTLLFLPPVCVNLGLAWFFGRTLAPGREALITRFARLEHPQPDIQRMAYTRRLTGIWAAFFLLMAAVSTALAATRRPRGMGVVHRGRQLPLRGGAVRARVCLQAPEIPE